MAVGGALFGGGRAASSSKYLVEFRAGKMTLGTDKMVTPDKRKGTVMIQQTDDQLMHFMWKDRGTGTIEDDLIIFPDDVEFKKVPQCTTGRVYLLKFKSSSRKMFFWMQEPKTDKDDEYCKKVNEYLNHPPAPGRGGSSGGGGGGMGGLDLSSLGDSELQSLLNNMSQQQLMQLFGGTGAAGLAALQVLQGGQAPLSGRQQRATGRANRETGSSSTPSRTPATVSAPAVTTTASTVTTTPALPATTSATPTTRPATASSGGAQAPIQLMDLQSILSGIQMPSELAAAGTSTASSGPTVDLAAGLTAELVEPLLKNPEFVRKMKELLPAEHQNNDLQEEVKGTIKSPQFQQALSLFSSAFQSGQLAPLIREFRLGDAAIDAAAKGNLQQFVEALQANKKEEEGKKKKEPEDDMALD